MSAYQGQKMKILDIIGKDGPIWKEMHKPQIMHIKVQNYGVRKLRERLEKRRKVR